MKNSWLKEQADNETRPGEGVTHPTTSEPGPEKGCLVRLFGPREDRMQRIIYGVPGNLVRDRPG